MLAYHYTLQTGAMNWKRGLFRVWVVGTAIWFGWFTYVAVVEGKPGFAALWFFGPPAGVLLLFWGSKWVWEWVWKGFRKDNS